MRQGKDANKLTAEARIGPRRQARDWLQANLAVYAKLVAHGPPPVRSTIRQRLEHWQQDADLAGVRGEAALAKLPETERAGWRKPWADVTELLGKTRSDPPPGTPAAKR